MYMAKANISSLGAATALGRAKKLMRKCSTLKVEVEFDVVLENQASRHCT